MLIQNVQLNGMTVDVQVEGGRFSRIGKELVATDPEVLDGTGKAILPSLVNMHMHAAMTLLRGYADDLALYDWLENHIWPTEAKLSEEDIYHGTRLACLEMIKSGTTEFNDMYWHFHGSARAVEEMGMRATLASVFIDFNDEKKAVEQRAETERLLAESESYSERITFSLGPHAIYTVSEASLRWIKDFSDKHDLPIHIHLSETKQEVEDCVKLHGLRPVEWLERIGFLGANVLAAHVIHVTDEEIEILARRRVRVVHCPVSNMKLVSGSFPYARMRAAGVEILLGTDGCASNNNLDLLEEMKVAALHAKLVHGDPTVLPAREAFLLATSAREIAEGARADCMLVDLKNHRLAPGFRLVDDLVYSADASCIDTVICAGQILMQGGQVKNETAIVSEAQGYKKRFQ